MLLGNVDFDSQKGFPAHSGNLEKQPLNFRELPGTLREVTEIRELAAKQGLSTVVLTGAEATKEALLAQLHLASYVHLATHGFFINQGTIEHIKANAFSGMSRAVVIRSTHWQEEERNISLLQGFRKVLKPGGLLLIDNPNPLRFWRIQHPEGTMTEQWKVLYFDLPLGQGETFGYVRYYGIETMKRLFQKAAMEVGAIWGDRAAGLTLSTARE